MRGSNMLLTGIALVGVVSGCAGVGMRPGSFSRDQVPAEYIENQLAGTWRGSFSQLAASLYEDEGNCVLQIRPDGTFTATISKAKLGTNNLANPGPVAYNDSFGGTYEDTHGFPASGCSTGAASVCLTESQLVTEIEKDMTTNGWTVGELESAMKQFAG